VLLEFPAAPQASMVRLAVAWTSLRQGRRETARREFLEFARTAPDSPYAVDALVLAAELATEAGDLEAAGRLLEQIVTTYPTNPRTDFARLNRGILLVRTGDPAGAQTALRDWLGRASFPALFGRAHVALGAALLSSGDSFGAQREFTLAQRDGLGPFASLGLGAVAMSRSRWDDAGKSFTEARDTGTPDVIAAAEYGLAAIAYSKSGGHDFKKPALAELKSLPPGARSGSQGGALLYVLTGISVAEKDWPGALDYARRLVDDYPAHEAADDGLERVAAGAASAAAWPVALKADLLLRERYPRSPFAEAGRVRVAEALLETGKADEARREVDQVLAASPNDGRATLLLARMRAAGGDRSGALEAYARAAREGQGLQGSGPALLGHGRLLVEDRQWSQARGVFEGLLKSEDTATVAEAARASGTPTPVKGRRGRRVLSDSRLRGAHLDAGPQGAALRRAELRGRQAEGRRRAGLSQAARPGRVAGRYLRSRSRGSRRTQPVTPGKIAGPCRATAVACCSSTAPPARRASWRWPRARRARCSAATGWPPACCSTTFQPELTRSILPTPSSSRWGPSPTRRSPATAARAWLPSRRSPGSSSTPPSVAASRPRSSAPASTPSSSPVARRRRRTSASTRAERS
jgi:tetratricopeptide (TPR) repeat protein